MRTFAPLLGVSLLVTAGASAQNLGGDNAIFNGSSSIDVEALTADNGMLGVELAGVGGSGNLFVSGRGVAGGNGMNMLYEVDPATGTLSTQYMQPTIVQDAWGIRDMAYDGTTGLLYGSNAGSNVVEFDTGAISGATPGFTGNSVAVPGLQARWIAKIQADDGGGNCIDQYVGGNWTGPATYFDLNGVTYANPNFTLNAGTYGAAYDAQRNTVWTQAQIGSPNPVITGMYLEEHDLDSGAPTGQVAYGNYTDAAGIAGGLASYIDATGSLQLVGFAQGAPDGAYSLGGRAQFGSTNATTGACVGLRGTSDGDILLTGGGAYDGNASFAIDLANSPHNGGLASICIGAASAVPINFPGITNNPILLDVSTMACFSAGAVNAGGATAPVPIPAATAGIQFAAQWIILVPGPGANFAKVTDAAGATVSN